MTEFRKAYRVEEALYVQYADDNVGELRAFVDHVNGLVSNGKFRIESFIVMGALQPHLFGSSSWRVIPIEEKEFLVFTEGTIVVMTPSAFRRRWRLTKPVYKKGGRNE